MKKQTTLVVVRFFFFPSQRQTATHRFVFKLYSTTYHRLLPLYLGQSLLRDETLARGIQRTKRILRGNQLGRLHGATNQAQAESTRDARVLRKEKNKKQKYPASKERRVGGKVLSVEFDSWLSSYYPAVYLPRRAVMPRRHKVYTTMFYFIFFSLFSHTPCPIIFYP